MPSRPHLVRLIQKTTMPGDKFAPRFCPQCGSPLYHPQDINSPVCQQCLPGSAPLETAD